MPARSSSWWLAVSASAGIYSYDYHVEKYMRDYKIIQMVLGGAQRDILDIAQGLYGPFKWSGMDEWIKQGGLVTEGFGGPRY